MSNLNNTSKLRIVSDYLDFEKNKPEGIYFYMDKKNIFKNYALIIGPKNTPYFGGYYFFEVIFPTNYPDSSPKIKLLTIDGKVRFNPNLYECGKVCLSILGTWNGPGWTNVMTLRTVLISIQSLILVEHPYFNEPGYEREIGTEHGIKRSKDYNSVIRRGTIEWAMIDMIKNPPEKYEKFVINHFKIKRNEIKDVVNTWIKEEDKEDFTDLATKLFETLDTI